MLGRETGFEVGVSLADALVVDNGVLDLRDSSTMFRDDEVDVTEERGWGGRGDRKWEPLSFEEALEREYASNGRSGRRSSVESGARELLDEERADESASSPPSLAVLYWKLTAGNWSTCSAISSLSLDFVGKGCCSLALAESIAAA